VRHLDDADDGVGAALEQLLHGLVDVLAAAERRCRLQHDDHVGCQLLNSVADDRDHRRAVLRERGRPAEHLDARCLGDLVVVGRDDGARKRVCGAGRADRPREQWATSDNCQVLARDSLRAAPRGDQAQHFH
jgi:hypothetical protein